MTEESKVLERLQSPTGSMTLQGGTLGIVLAIAGMFFTNFGGLERSIERQETAQGTTSEQVAVLAGKLDVLVQAIGSIQELRAELEKRKANVDTQIRRIEQRITTLEAKHARRGR